MEDEIILTRPSDRRLLGEDSDLTPGPPGVESDSFDLVQKQGKLPSQDKKSRRSPPSHARRSPVTRIRRSTSRGRKSKSRTRETPTYGREYSPPRRYGGPVRRRSRERVRSPDRTRKRSRERIERRRDRRERTRSPERYRTRRSRSQSGSPRSRRWSPKKKPASPPPPPPITPSNPYAMPGYNDAYATYPAQYPQQYSADYGPAPPPPAAFSSSYPPPPAWGMVAPLGDDYTAPSGWPAAPVPPPAPSIETDEEQMKRDGTLTSCFKNNLCNNITPAVAQEVQNQRDQLKKQRNDYLKRASGLKREMKILKEQRNDLVSGSGPSSPTTKGFLEENDRLQSQIQKKLNTMENVIDMLSGIIGDEKPPTPPSPVVHKKIKKKKNESDDDSSPERLKTKVMESLKSKRGESSKKEILDSLVKMELKVVKEPITPKKSEEIVKKINYSFYDPEMHWCQTCNAFPKTAKDYLNHLHSKEHLSNVKSADTPWHEHLVNNEFPTYPNASSKRAPIRGLQFFTPSTAWFCKLCNFWMGDLHCASAHLKSQVHSEKYTVYIEQNPHFEVDWMAERQKAYDVQRAPPPPPQITSVSTSGMDLLESIPLQINTQKKIEKIDKTEEPVEKISKKRKKKIEDKKEKKKKKRSKKRKKSSSSSSSSSSESSSDSESIKKSEEDRANSIRVAMRNLSRSQERLNVLDGRGKWTTVQEGRMPEPVPPPPPSIVTAEAAEDRKKDELMISQWNTPQPIISESEKKLLEELKGKLKGKGPSEEKRKSTKGSEGSSRTATKDLKKIEKESPTSSKSRDVKEGRRSRSRTKKSPSVAAIEDREVEKRSRSPDRGSRSRRRSASKGRVKRSLSRGRVTRIRRSRSRDRRSRSRDRRSRSRGRRSRSRGGRGRSRSRDNRRSRSRSRGGRRRRSRSVKRRSRSYGRRRSYSRSRSRSSTHRIEKPIVRYPEFRPRVPENKKVTKMKADDETERKKTPPTKKAMIINPMGKKLPFIGRMPVFKKQNQGSDDKKDGENADPNQMDMHMGCYDHFDGMMVDYDDLMPDPMQYVTLMGAPPPPPPTGGPPEYEDEKDMLPPGVDETEADLVPKPISDAPIPRKGPLPRDFQEALNIIFPGEKKPDEEEATEESKGDTAPEEPEKQLSEEPEAIVPDSAAVDDVQPVPPPTIVEDDTSQMSIGEEAFIGFPPTNLSDHSQDVPDQLLLVSAIPPPPPPPPPKEQEEKNEKVNDDISKENSEKNENSEKKENSPTPSEKLRRQEELDDLAMLGIDADDLAAQCM